jgi:hypothetical protein
MLSSSFKILAERGVYELDLDTLIIINMGCSSALRRSHYLVEQCQVKGFKIVGESGL